MEKIIIAVSGGPDSMALLDMLRKEDKYHCIVAHINYQQRDTALRDQKIVEEYCQQHQLTCHVKNAPQNVSGNFQAFARDFRYNFFLELAEKYESSSIYVAHHQDDLLETYIMQLKRDITPTIYGLAEEFEYEDNIKIRRPLLNYSKTDLVNYCQQHEIPFGVDESNLESVYLRNKVRINIVDKMSLEEKQAMIREIAERNQKLFMQQTQTEEFFEKFLAKDTQIDFLLALSHDTAADVLRLWLKSKKIHNISQNELYSILEFLAADQGSKYLIDQDKYLFNNYGQLAMAAFAEDYHYEFDEIKYGDYDFFSFHQQGAGTDAVTLAEDDFPIVVRNFQEGDKIELPFGTKRVSQWFKDRKIPLDKRERWPIMLNKNGDIILVPGLGCNIDHYSTNPTVFMVK